MRSLLRRPVGRSRCGGRRRCCRRRTPTGGAAVGTGRVDGAAVDEQVEVLPHAAHQGAHRGVPAPLPDGDRPVGCDDQRGGARGDPRWRRPAATARSPRRTTRSGPWRASSPPRSTTRRRAGRRALTRSSAESASPPMRSPPTPGRRGGALSARRPARPRPPWPARRRGRGQFHRHQPAANDTTGDLQAIEAWFRRRADVEEHIREAKLGAALRRLHPPTPASTQCGCARRCSPGSSGLPCSR
jgi:hypothetical protein